MIITKQEQLDDSIRALRMQAYELLKAGKVVEAVVKQKVNRRSTLQNSFLHLMFEKMSRFCQETGYNPYDVKYISAELIKEFSKAFYGIKNTSKLNTKEFGEFVDKVQLQWVEDTCGEYEILIPNFDAEKKGYYNYE